MLARRGFLRATAAAPALLLTRAAHAQAPRLDMEIVNAARFSAGARAKGAIDPAMVKAQVLLDRRSISPGVIDGHDGENVRKALAQFRRQEGLPAGEGLDEETWRALGAQEAQDALTRYEITRKDADYPFAERIPADYAEQAKMKRLAYVSPVEMFAERFHMDDDLLKALNSGARYEAGESIVVANVRREKKGRAKRVEADKRLGLVIAFGDDGSIIASYPATIGSSATPSPEGEHKITRIARDPTYHYDPEKNFQQGRNTRRLTLPPGPNNPVGSVWIALSKPTYGVHGAPEPSKVSKTSSHGCVRLTNWDAEELAGLVRPGVVVAFKD